MLIDSRLGGEQLGGDVVRAGGDGPRPPGGWYEHPQVLLGLAGLGDDLKVAGQQ